jgi:hypothetical protein
MTQKVIYFTAGPVATVDELADIAKLNAATEQPYSVKVFNGAQSPLYGYGKEAADFVAGTIPTVYNAVPVIDPDAIPDPGGVGVGGTVDVTDLQGGTVEVTIDSVDAGAGVGSITDPTKSIFTNGENVNVTNSAGSKTVTGVVAIDGAEDVAIALGATQAIITTAQALVVPVTGVYATTATVTVANGVVTAIALS